MKGFAKKRDDIHARLDDLKNEVETLVSDLQAEWDGRSERWQESERGEHVQGQIEELANVQDSIDSAMADLSEVDL